MSQKGFSCGTGSLTKFTSGQTDPGHHVTFLSNKDCQFPLTVEEVEKLQPPLQLATDDHTVLQKILDSLRTDGRLPFEWTPQEMRFIDNSEVDRIVPYLIYRFKFKVWPKYRIVPEMPIHVMIEPTSVCNLRCPMCFQSDPTFRVRGLMGMMDLNLFQSVIDQADEGGTGALTMGSRGEPFLHPRFGDMLALASEKRSFFEIKVNTNATRLNEAACHSLLSSKATLINLSIDTHKAEIYKNIRVRGRFEQVLANVKRLSYIRQRHYPGSSVELRVTGVKVSKEQVEEEFRLFWLEFVDNVAYVKMQERWDTYNNQLRPDRHKVPCEFLWDRLQIWFDGICNPCDEDYKSTLSPGNVKDKSIKEIWNGPILTNYRKIHSCSERGSLMPCDRCSV